ncbi:MAG: hypothetical protein HQM02_11405 [Magnetococcales bacterium]|nr:hypothetical protein [Magnetococcales bacterium]
MKTSVKTLLPEEGDSLESLRESLKSQLFETGKPDLVALLASGLRTTEAMRPTPEQLLKPLQTGLKKFQITLMDQRP